MEDLMVDINKIMLVGRLTRDVEVKYTTSGTEVAKFTLAVNRRVKSGEEWKDEPSFFDCVMWGHKGLHPYLLKGKQVAVDGELNQNRWEQDGQKRSKVEIIIGNIELLGSNQSQGAGAAPPPPHSTSQKNGSLPPEFDETIPF
jgi:single-strand DNA-binding protein